MRFKVQLLNYDSEWVDYCNSPTSFYAEAAKEDLLRKGFKEYQVRIKKTQSRD